MTSKTWSMTRIKKLRSAGLLLALIVVSMIAVTVQGVEQPTRGARTSAP